VDGFDRDASRSYGERWGRWPARLGEGEVFAAQVADVEILAVKQGVDHVPHFAFVFAVFGREENNLYEAECCVSLLGLKLGPKRIDGHERCAVTVE
jgi:hypothetical protein